MTRLYQQIVPVLKEENIPFTLYKHDPMWTITEASTFLDYPLEQGTKSLVLEGEDKRVIATVPGHEHCDFRAIKRAVGVKRISMCREKTLAERFGVERGGVAPFGYSCGVILVVSSSLFEVPYVYFTPGRREITVRISGKDFKQIMLDAVIL